MGVDTPTIFQAKDERMEKQKGPQLITGLRPLIEI
jgi:hypothetical protein